MIARQLLSNINSNLVHQAKEFSMMGNREELFSLIIKRASTF
jgi:hypothetical protein